MSPDPTTKEPQPSKGAIFVSCGHEVSDVSDIIDVRFGDVDCDAINGIRRCIMYGSYCRACADYLQKHGGLIETDEQEAAWLAGEATNNDQP